MRPGRSGLERLRSQQEMARWLPEFRYPLGDFLYMLFEGARLAVPRLGRMDSFFEAVGEVVALRYREGAVGKLAFRMFEGKDPIAILGQMPATYATRQTHGGRVFRRLGEAEAQLVLVDDPLPPGYHLGLIRTFVTFNGHPAEVFAEQRSLTSCTYRVVWQRA